MFAFYSILMIHIMIFEYTSNMKYAYKSDHHRYRQFGLFSNKNIFFLNYRVLCYSILAIKHHHKAVGFPFKLYSYTNFFHTPPNCLFVIFDVQKENTRETVKQSLFIERYHHHHHHHHINDKN